MSAELATWLAEIRCDTLLAPLADKYGVVEVADLLNLAGLR